MTRYSKPVTRMWFLQKKSFMLYFAREFTALPVLLYALNLGVGAACHGLGEPPFRAWLAAQASWPLIGLAVLTLGASLLHAGTWFVVSERLLPSVLSRALPRFTVAVAQAVALLGIGAALVAGLAWLGAP